ncbi:autotransporter outer membrane beta-barrel domain-containing protein [Termitidicoccus mucosus]
MPTLAPLQIPAPRVSAVLASLAACLLALAFPLRAQTVIPVTSDTTVTIAGTGDRVALGAGVTREYQIADGVTLTFTGTQSGLGGVFDINNAAGALVIGPATPGGTGGAIFTATTSGEAGAFRNTGTVSLTNVTFINNRSLTTSNNAGGGAIRADNTALTTLTNVSFIDNSAQVSGGAIRLGGTLSMTGGTLSGNYAATGFGGAIYINQTVNQATFTDVTFASNRASQRAGAIYINQAGTTTLNNVTFTDNWAGANGGAIMSGHASAVVEINMTKDGARDHYAFTGNLAGNANASAADIADNTAPAAVAINGGFYNATANGATLILNIADAVTLVIGDPSAPDADTLKGGGGALYKKQGAGTLVLHGNSTGAGGTLAITAGKVLLGNNAASWGTDANARVLVENATFGGLGKITASSSIAAGGVLQVGLDGATSSGTLTASGTLFFDNNSRLDLDLFAGNSADLLSAAALNQTGTVTINLGATQTGSNFTLATWTGGSGLNLADLRLTFNGEDSSARHSATAADLALSGNSLLLQSNTTFGLALRWTGLDDGIWADRAANWSDGAAPGSEATHFLTGDSVTFGDAAAPDKRVVTIAAAGATASEMNVTATSGAYIFTGSGGILVTATSALADTKITATGTSGKLIKTGAGALAFENTGANLFENGVEIQGGVLAYTAAAQLGLGAGRAIEFTATGTLRAAAGGAVSGTLAAPIHIAAGKTAAFDTLAFDTAYAGTLTGADASAIFAKIGSGTLTLTGDSSAFTGTTRADAGTLLLATAARLGGVALVKNGATFGGSGSAAAVTVESGGILRPGAADAAGTLSVGTLNLAAGGIVSINLVSGTTTAAQSVNSRLEAGTLNLLAGGGDLSLYTINLSSLLPGVYDIGSGTALAGAHVTYGDNFELGGRQRVLFDTAAAAGRLYITVEQSRNDIMRWTGAAGTAWAGGLDWLDPLGAPLAFVDGDVAVFSSTGAAPAPRAVEVNADVIASDLRVNGAGDLRFYGAGGIMTDAAIGTLSGSTGVDGKLKKDGAGTLAFENTGGNLFKGGIELSGGVIAFNDGAQLATTGTAGITFLDSATLRPTASGTIANKLAIAAGRSATFDVVGTQSTLVWSGTYDAASAGTLVKTGSGVFTLTGANTNAAASVTVAAGGMFLGSPDAALGGAVTVGAGAVFGGAGSVSGTVTVANGATLQVGSPVGGAMEKLTLAAVALADGSRLAGTGTLAGAATIGAAGGLVTADIGAGGRLAVTATLDGTGTLAKSGGGELVYATAAALGHAATQIDDGVLMLRDIAAPAAVSHSFVLNGGWLDLSETAGFSGTDPAGANDWTGLRLSGDTGRVIGANDQIALATPGVFGFQIGGTTTATQGVYVVVDTGSGTVALTGSNSYAGLTRLRSGVLQVAADASLGDTALRRAVVFEGGALYVDGDFTTQRALEFAAAGGTVEVAAGRTTAWAGTLGDGALAKAGAGTLVISGTLANAGGVTVAGGVLRGTPAGLAGVIQNQSVVEIEQLSGTAALAGTITGATGVVSKIGSGTLVLGSGGSLSAGTLNLREGGLVLNGAVPLAIGHTFNIAVGSSFAASGASQITAPLFVNNGVLRIGKAADGADFGRMAITGDYNGYGEIRLNVLLSENLIVNADRLAISGSATGETLVFLNMETTSAAAGDTRIQLIEAGQGMDGGAAFRLAERYTSGGYDLMLSPDGFLYIKTIPAELPAVLGMDVAPILIGKTSLGALANRLALARSGGASHGGALWAGGLYGYDRLKSGAYDGGDASTYGVQTGADKRWSGDTWALTAGVFYDYAKSDLHFLGDSGSAETTANGAGVYLSYDFRSFYVDALFRAAREDYTVTVPGAASFDTEGESRGGALELGYMIKTRSGEKIVPYARVGWLTHDIDATTDSFDRVYRIDGAESLECRAGVRMWNQFAWGAKTRLVPRLGIALARELEGGTEVTVDATRFADTEFEETATRKFRDNRTKGTGVLLEGGAALEMGRHWALSLDASLYMADKMENFTVNLGLRRLW